MDVNGNRRPWRGVKVSFRCNQSESEEKGAADMVRRLKLELGSSYG